MRKIKYSKSISILITLMLIVFVFAGCNFLKAVLPDTNEGTDTNNTESTTGGNEETAATSNSGDNSNTGTSAPPDLGGITEFIEQEVLVRIKPGVDVEKILSEVGGKIIETLPQISVIRIKLEPQVSVAQAIQTLEELEEVEYAEPNGICYMDLAPNDSDYGSSQWAPQLTGAESAWDMTTGSDLVTIAITDTGVDGTHPDFEGKVIAGWDTYNNVEILAGTDSSVNSHGTHCAGIAAAVGNNSQGIAGVAWGSKIMPMKICDDGPYYSASWSDMAEAFIWAADPEKGAADIISCSFGGKGYSQTMKDAIDYAVIDMECAMFASMGNSSCNEISYPAGYQSVIAVGATDAHDEIADFSTTGNHMSVCAPGVEIYSTMPGGGYGYMSGTSMSCPFVAGAAALILSQNSGMSPEGVKTQLEETAVNLGSHSTFGYGRVNLAVAVGAPEANKYGVVDVLVTDRLNHPISGASVILWQGETVISTTNSNEDGHAKFEYVQAGEYDGISVSFPGFDSCLAADNPVTVVAGSSVSITIAFATAEMYYVGAYAITYQDTSTGTSTSIGLLQANMDQLVEDGLIPDSFQLNELPPLTKGMVEHAIYVDWHSYPDATGYKVYRSVNGGGYSVIYQDEPTTSYDWYSFWDYDVSEVNSYTYYVTAYGTGWETDPSPAVTIDTWLPPCSLISPTDELIITNPTPTFTWNPVGALSLPYGSIYSGRSNLDIWNHTTGDWVWNPYFDDLTTSSAIYNQDGQATPLVAGNGYEWQIDSFGYDENGKLIAYSWSEYWDFYYGNIVADVGACAITYQDTSNGTSTSMELFQANMDRLVEEELIPDSLQLNELPPLAKGIVGYAIDVDWHSYPDATGYKVYRSVNGASYILVLDWEAPPGYEWYGFGDWDVIPGDTYDYYVTAYGSGWETDPSQTVTIDTWLPPCTLNSPPDGAVIDINPIFSWSSGAPDFPSGSLYSGSTCMLVYDLTTHEYVWIICFDDPYTSTATYNQDGQATPLSSGHDYTWHSWTSGYDENWNRIAVSESEHWEFNYIGD